jgi:hypothetical protein
MTATRGIVALLGAFRPNLATAQAEHQPCPVVLCGTLDPSLHRICLDLEVDVNGFWWVLQFSRDLASLLAVTSALHEMVQTFPMVDPWLCRWVFQPFHTMNGKHHKTRQLSFSCIEMAWNGNGIAENPQVARLRSRSLRTSIKTAKSRELRELCCSGQWGVSSGRICPACPASLVWGSQ